MPNWYLFLAVIFGLCKLASTVVSGGLDENIVCGASSISARLEHAVWQKLKAGSRPYYSTCKLLHARYNCSRFRTSAASYELSFPTTLPQITQQKPKSRQEMKDNKMHAAEQLAANKCRVPDLEQIMKVLIRQPTRIFMIGDSHIQQFYISLMCTFQNVMKDVVVYERDCVSQYSKYSNSTAASLLAAEEECPFHPRVYESYEASPECHTVDFQDYTKFYLNPVKSEQQLDGSCQVRVIIVQFLICQPVVFGCAFVLQVI